MDYKSLLKRAVLDERDLTLDELRHCSSLRTFMQGILDEYPKAIRQGRVKEWCNVLRAIANLYDE